jgi:4-diphosphocytidyl-2-C-methyl-D-erythritol kinase
MIAFPPCKINLGLHVTGKRTDGFHALESVFLPINFTDALEVIENPDQNPGEYTFSHSGIAIPGEAKMNSVIKAYVELSKRFELPAVKIHLHKVIPIGAGLGGGSSNGAAMLVLLNEKFKLNLPQTELLEYAARLGSDCPFFIVNQACYVTGRGELLEPYALDLSTRFMVLVNPGIHSSTAEAFAGITPQSSREDIREICRLPVTEWKGKLINDFERGLSNKYPEIKAIKEGLYEAGADYAAMTGTGSTVFGIFEKDPGELEFPPTYWVFKLAGASAIG